MPPHSLGLRLPHVIRSGAEQMAIDAALLRWAAAGRDRLVVRTYGWERPTLSLGRAEPFPWGWDERALLEAGIEVVRRPTGGDAVLHDEEVTFAVAAAVPGAWAGGPRGHATAVAEALVFALTQLGLSAEVIPDRAAPIPRAAPGAHPCFARASVGEVIVEGYKAAGIASRFTRGAALSHASVPLSRRHRDVAVFRHDRGTAAAGLRAHARSIGETLGRRVGEEEIFKPLLQALERRLGMPLSEAPFEACGVRLA